MFGTACQFVMASFVALRYHWSVAWLRVSKLIRECDFFVAPATEMHHKVVIIGDGFAEGLGDWVILGGPAGLTRFLTDRARGDPKVRMKWTIINRGCAGTTSADWLPAAAAAAAAAAKDNASGDGGDGGKNRGRKNLFDGILRSRAAGDAEIVIVAVGTLDVARNIAGMPPAALKKAPEDEFGTAEFCATARNIGTVCDALLAAGKRIVLCNTMTCGEGLAKGGGVAVARRLNRQLQQYAAAVAASPDAHGRVAYVRMDDGRTSRPENRSFDGMHLNSKGYKFFANELFDEALRNMMVAVEWTVWKRLVNFSGPARTVARSPIAAAAGGGGGGGSRRSGSSPILEPIAEDAPAVAQQETPAANKAVIAKKDD
ncbi:unnamed protein product [Phaeothamnion confervicola]